MTIFNITSKRKCKNIAYNNLRLLKSKYFKNKKLVDHQNYYTVPHISISVNLLFYARKNNITKFDILNFNAYYYIPDKKHYVPI